MAAKKDISEIISEIRSRQNEVADLDAILAIGDPWDRRNAVVEYVAAKRRVGGEASLTPFERIVDAAMIYEFKEMQGTLFDEALRADRCAEAVAVLEQIGARQVAGALRSARAIYAAVPPDRAASARTLEELQNLAGEAVLRTIRARMVEDEVSDRLVDYIGEHSAAMRRD